MQCMNCMMGGGRVAMTMYDTWDSVYTKSVLSVSVLSVFACPKCGRDTGTYRKFGVCIYCTEVSQSPRPEPMNA